MNETIVTIVGILWLIACVMCVAEMLASKEGYEDETGFHYGKPKDKE